MKINVSAKNYKIDDATIDRINKKFRKLEKYFDKDVKANVVISKIKDTPKIETTISTKQTIFRAEASNKNLYEAIDTVVNKLASQMSRFKGKLEARYKDNKALKFEFIPDPEKEDEKSLSVARKKEVKLDAMTVEEAILQMEMLDHDFFVFQDKDTAEASVVYKRNNGTYGLMQTSK